MLVASRPARRPPHNVFRGRGETSDIREHLISTPKTSVPLFHEAIRSSERDCRSLPRQDRPGPVSSIGRWEHVHADCSKPSRDIFQVLPPHIKSSASKIDDNHFSFPNSMGRFMPTLLAERRTLSSSSIPMPGLYLSSNVTYVLCARTYARYCSACATACSGVVSGRKCSRRR